jgi:hypothetical protein
MGGASEAGWTDLPLWKRGIEGDLRTLLDYRPLAGGSPAASHFSCLAKKSNQKKATPTSPKPRKLTSDLPL